jgi:polar amino acid transport system substrate-binding protein
MKSKALISAASSFVKIVLAIAVTCGATEPRANAANHPLTVVVSLDIPPYVMDHVKRGVEVYIMHRALPNYKMKWVQMDYTELEAAVSDKKADIAMSIQTRKPNMFYSVNYIGFANVAISKKTDHLKIEDVADLKGHPVLTWQNAWTELGNEFKKQYAPGSTERTNYIEVADQAAQVRRFWEGNGMVIVINPDNWREYVDNAN